MEMLQVDGSMDGSGRGPHGRLEGTERAGGRGAWRRMEPGTVHSVHDSKGIPGVPQPVLERKRWSHLPARGAARKAEASSRHVASDRQAARVALRSHGGGAACAARLD